MNTLNIKGAAGHSLCWYEWPVPGDAKVVVHCIHGMAEHAQRYQGLAKYLNAAGVAVTAHDHRGHGANVSQHQHELGHFADHNGWALIIKDAMEAVRETRRRYPEAAVVVFGHSMGSFVAQQLAIDYGLELDGVVLSASDCRTGLPIKAGILVGKLIRRMRGANYRSPLYDRLITLGFNKKVGQPVSRFDWLSHDPSVIRLYDRDPLCGFVPSVVMWMDIMTGLSWVSQTGRKLSVPPKLPIWIYAGDEDPVGGYGVRVGRLADSYRESGLQDVTFTLYDGGRHEMHNEVGRNHMLRDFVSWLNQHYSASKPQNA